MILDQIICKNEQFWSILAILPQKINVSNNIFFQTLVSINVTNKTSKSGQCPYYYAI